MHKRVLKTFFEGAVRVQVVNMVGSEAVQALVCQSVLYSRTLLRCAALREVCTTPTFVIMGLTLYSHLWQQRAAPQAHAVIVACNLRPAERKFNMTPRQTFESLQALLSLGEPIGTGSSIIELVAGAAGASCEGFARYFTSAELGQLLELERRALVHAKGQQ